MEDINTPRRITCAANGARGLAEKEVGAKASLTCVSGRKDILGLLRRGGLAKVLAQPEERRPDLECSRMATASSGPLRHVASL